MTALFPPNSAWNGIRRRADITAADVPAWLEPGLLLLFLVGLVIGAAIGALIVGLL